MISLSEIADCVFPSEVCRKLMQIYEEVLLEEVGFVPFLNHMHLLGHVTFLWNCFLEGGLAGCPAQCLSDHHPVRHRTTRKNH